VSTESRGKYEKKEYTAKISVKGKPEPIWQAAKKSQRPYLQHPHTFEELRVEGGL